MSDNNKLDLKGSKVELMCQTAANFIGTLADQAAVDPAQFLMVCQPRITELLRDYKSHNIISMSNRARLRSSATRGLPC